MGSVIPEQGRPPVIYDVCFAVRQNCNNLQTSSWCCNHLFLNHFYCTLVKTPDFGKMAGLPQNRMLGIGDWEQHAPADGNQTTDRAWMTDGLNSNQTTLDDPGTHLSDWNNICFRSRP
jgi:hypothetical protein